jgi:hypothetical protein
MDTAATIHGALPCPGCGTPRRDESFREPCSACRAPGFTADLLVSVFGLGAGGGKVGMIVLGTILAGLVALTVAIATGRTGVDPKETDVFALLVMQTERIGFSTPRSFRLHHGDTDGFSLPIMILGDRTAREECVRAIERTLDMRVTAPSMPA